MEALMIAAIYARKSTDQNGVGDEEKSVTRGVAMEVLEQHHDLEQVRALLGHARIDTTQVYASIRPPELKRAVAFYEEQAVRMLTE